MAKRKRRILVVDDEESMRKLLTHVLSTEDCEVGGAADGKSALAALADGGWDLVVQDVKMPGMDGIELLRRIKDERPETLVIVITAFGTWETAVEAMRLGAYDYITKPFDTDLIRAVVTRVLERRDAAAELKGRRDGVPAHLAGNTPAMQEVLRLIRRIGPSDATVLIQGESGTGKELVARAIHWESLRANEPFLAVNCGGFSETLLESELFGHIRGSFTGAVADKKGLLEVADRGTFFLDEVAEMSTATQVKFLRVLEAREFLSVGSVEPRRADVRFITATNKDIDRMVDEGKFREDLYYRLNVIRIVLPPLRERREDIPLLAGHFLARSAARTEKEFSGFDEEAMGLLLLHDWPGNVRELENAVERAVALAEGPEIRGADVAATVARKRRPEDISSYRIPLSGINLEGAVEDVERKYIRAALEMTRGNLTQAAKLLGTSFRSLRYRVKKLKLDREEFGG